MAQLMPLPLTVSWFNKIQIVSGTGLLADVGNTRQSPEGRKMDVCVRVCMHVTLVLKPDASVLILYCEGLSCSG